MVRVRVWLGFRLGWEDIESQYGFRYGKKMKYGYGKILIANMVSRTGRHKKTGMGRY